MNFLLFQDLQAFSVIRKGDVGPGDVDLFKGGTPSCQRSLTLRQSKAFPTLQALRFTVTSSWEPLDIVPERDRAAKIHLYSQFSHNP